MTDVSDCPHFSVLQRIGLDEWDSAELGALELHIEHCDNCRSILQNLANAGRFDLTEVLGAAVHLPEHPPELPGFRLQKELGRGGGSVVYLAEDISTLRQVAVKLIPGGWIREPEMRSRVLEEVRFSARMQHHHLVRLYRVEETLHWFLLVFEYVPGGTLRDRLHLPMKPVEVAALMQTIALAVEHIHQQGVLHLDLKPSNVLLDDSAGSQWHEVVPKVSDFGIACTIQLHCDDDASETARRGTPSYMAPEQVIGQADRLSPATDVYGLGGILFTLLTGRPPFDGAAPQEILRQVVCDRPAWRSSESRVIPEGLRAIASRCLEKSPARRFPTPRALAGALQEWLNREQRRSSAAGLSSTIPMSHRRKTAAVVLATLAIATLAATQLLTARHELPQPTESSLAANSSAPLNPDPLNMYRWVEELAKEPAAFNNERTAALVEISGQQTKRLLSISPPPVEELLRAGVLQQRAAERFGQSTLKELYPAAEQLVENALRLLEQALEVRPDDQMILMELIGARYFQNLIPLKIDHLNQQQHNTHQLNCVRRNPAIVQLIRRIRDQRQRVFWMGQVLDHFRGAVRQGSWLKSERLFEEVQALEEQCWALTETDQRIPDLAFRHALMKFSSDPAEWPVQTSDAWVFEDHRRLMETEAIFVFLADQFFHELLNRTPEASVLTASTFGEPLIRSACQYMQRLGRDPDDFPLILHNELIRPVAALSARFRAEDQLERAELIEAAYTCLSEAADAIYPDSVHVHLAISEAKLQTWKNALRRNEDERALEALQDSLSEAQQALEFAPDSVRARFQVADRIKRLTRIQSSRTVVQQSDRPIADDPDF